MNKPILLLLSFILTFYSTSFAQTETDEGKVEDVNEDNKSIKWMSFEEAAAAMKKEPRKIVIDVYTDWCGWCKKMDKTTFADENVAKYINEKYYAVKMDAENTDVIRFRDTDFGPSEANPKYNEMAIQLLQGKMSFPTTVYLDEQFNIIQPISGFMDAKEFKKVITYFGEEAYKSASWEEYNKTYKASN